MHVLLIHEVVGKNRRIGGELSRERGFHISTNAEIGSAEVFSALRPLEVQFPP